MHWVRREGTSIQNQLLFMDRSSAWQKQDPVLCAEWMNEWVYEWMKLKVKVRHSYTSWHFYISPYLGISLFVLLCYPQSENKVGI